MKIIEQITEIYDDAQVISIGEPEVLVEYDDNSKNKILEALKVAAVCILIFFGSAFTIMAFNNDISISGVFEHFYKQIMGVEKPQVSVLEVFYCIGLAVGIILFFNHIGKRKLSDDVTPIQVEMDKHNKDTWNTIIDKVKEKTGCLNIYCVKYFCSVIAFLVRGRSVSRCICIRARDRSGAAYTSVQQDENIILMKMS